MNVCSLCHITKIYNIGNNKITALNDISVNIEKGDFVSIIGTSGSGKSTLMNILGFLDVPSSGDYYFYMKKTESLNDKELSKLRNREIGFVFQSFNLISKLTAFQNVELPLIYREVSSKERKKLVNDALRLVGLENRKSHKPTEMSGGQQQRVAIARAIVANTNIILADEPTGNLDSNSSKDIMEILTNLNKIGKTVIVITHDREIAKQTKRIIHLKDGEIYKDKRLIDEYEKK